jgi:3-oxoadipate enol-lactonase
MDPELPAAGAHPGPGPAELTRRMTTSPDPRRRDVYSVASAGETIYAEATGAGRPVVLCHGLGGNHAIWWRQVDTFARDHRVVTWDQRGFGNSTAVTSDVSIEAAAADLLAVLTELDLRGACVVGQSMGAFTALRAALTEPARFGALVISTSLVAAPREHTEALNAATGTRSWRDQHPVVSDQFSASHPDLVVLYNLISSFGAKPTSAAMIAHMADANFTDTELARLAVPVSFAAAELDQFCPPAVMRYAQKRFRDATMHVLAGASHSAYYEAPAAWNELVLALADGRLR